MRRAELMRRSIRSAERNRDVKLSTRHRVHIWGVVHDLVERDQRKAECHKLDNRPQPDHRRPHAKARESILADRSIDNTSRSEALEQALAYFVSAIVFGDLFAHEENVRITLQFFRERFVERLAISNFPHAFAPFA